MSTRNHGGNVSLFWIHTSYAVIETWHQMGGTWWARSGEEHEAGPFPGRRLLVTCFILKHPGPQHWYLASPGDGAETMQSWLTQYNVFLSSIVKQLGAPGGRFSRSSGKHHIGLLGTCSFTPRSSGCATGLSFLQRCVGLAAENR